jgi:hypothetical protein
VRGRFSAAHREISWCGLKSSARLRRRAAAKFPVALTFLLLFGSSQKVDECNSGMSLSAPRSCQVSIHLLRCAAQTLDLTAPSSLCAEDFQSRTANYPGATLNLRRGEIRRAAGKFPVALPRKLSGFCFFFTCAELSRSIKEKRKTPRKHPS